MTKKLIAKLKQRFLNREQSRQKYADDSVELACRNWKLKFNEVNSLLVKSATYAHKMQEPAEARRFECDQLKMDLKLARAQHAGDMEVAEREVNDAKAELEMGKRGESEAIQKWRDGLIQLDVEKNARRRAENFIQHLGEERDRLQKLLDASPDALRAMLVQLRVFASSDKGRTGFCVGTFIPDEVIEKLRAHPEEAINFRDMVWAQTLDYAMRGIFHINSRGNCSAILFSNLGSKGGACGAVFDVDGKLEVALASRCIDPTVRAIENQVLAEQQGRPVPVLDWEQFLKQDAAIQELMNPTGRTFTPDDLLPPGAGQKFIPRRAGE